MKTGLGRLEAVLQLLEQWSWERVRQNPRFFVYSPPASKESQFELFVPRDTGAADFDRSLDNCVDAIASYSRLPFASVETKLLRNAEVIALRLQGDSFSGGAAPFPKFERMLEHLKRTISRAASLIVTDDPLSLRVPPVAANFLNECWFLQTARGSFVTRVALPTLGTFDQKQQDLFRAPREKIDVSTTLRRITKLVGERVLTGDKDLYSDSDFADVRPSLSVGVLEEFSRLLRGSDADRIDLTFNRAGEEATVQMPNLTEDRLTLLDAYVSFVRDQFHQPLHLDVEGKVFEVRRARRGGKQSLVGLEAIVNGRLEHVSFRVAQEILHIMLDHFHSGAAIRVRGSARRLRTQIRIESGFEYQE